MNRPKRILLEWPHQGVETVEGRFLFMHNCQVDLGLENLGISKLYVPLTMSGLKIPGIDYMMVLDKGGSLRIAKGGHSLPHLPFDWFSATYGVRGNQYIWVGPKVREEQIMGIDDESRRKATSNYKRFEPRTYGYEEVEF